MTNIVTTKPMTMGRMDTSPTRCWGVGSLGVGFWSFMDGWMLKGQSGLDELSTVDRGLLFPIYSSRPGRDMSSRMASLGLLLWWRMASICSVMGISMA
jgi:hypothetical protein